MSSPLILVDSSVWIDFFQGTDKSKENYSLRTFLKENRAGINSIIRLEVLTGSRSTNEFKKLGKYFDDLPFLEMTPSVYELGEKLRFDLRNQGWTIPVPDILIASVAIEYGVPLHHRDDHFQVMENQVSSLVIYEG